MFNKFNPIIIGWRSTTKLLGYWMYTQYFCSTLLCIPYYIVKMYGINFGECEMFFNIFIYFSRSISYHNSIQCKKVGIFDEFCRRIPFTCLSYQISLLCRYYFNNKIFMKCNSFLLLYWRLHYPNTNINYTHNFCQLLLRFVFLSKVWPS